MATPPSQLRRSLSLQDAVILGLSAMLGAGVFVAAGPASAAAGSALLVGLALAALVALLNASSMAQLAALYPESGGAYVYAQKRLGPLWGFLAGWGFVIGKTASCTAMALAFSHYLGLGQEKIVAIAIVLLLSWINSRGVQKTALASRVLLGIVLTTLALVVLAALLGGGVQTERLELSLSLQDIPGVLQAAGFLFFAFAGYARIATLGEEVQSPRSTIPRAIGLALGTAFLIYFVVFLVTLLTVDTETLARGQAPLVLAVESGAFANLAPLVRVGACVASLSVLLSLLVGVSRTAYAMAKKGDLPQALSAVHPRSQTPQRAEGAVSVAVATLLLFTDLRSAIGFSSFCILFYYALANASAWTFTAKERMWPSSLATMGLISCVLVALNLPVGSIIMGASVLSLGALIFRIKRTTLHSPRR